MKYIHLFAATVFLALSSVAAWAVPPGNWTQTFSDDFNGTTLDATKWSTGYLWSGVINNELEGMRPENVTVGGGVCTIKLEKRDCNNQSFQGQYEYASGSHYASGCITTFNKFTQAYGYFEARIQTPTDKAAWPAFWLLPDRGAGYGGAFVDNTGSRSFFTVAGQPNGAEIDVLESFGSWKKADNTAKAHSGFIWDYSNGALADYDRVAGLGDYLSIPNPDTTWHVYGLYWAPGIVATYIDDQLVNYWANPNAPGCPEYMLLNCAASLNDWSGTNISQSDMDAGLPSLMKIDWVHVYTGTPTTIKPVTAAWMGRDISNATIMQGNSTVTGTTCTIQAEGAWDWTTQDDFRYAFRSLVGDGSIVARVSRLDNVGNGAANAGLMIRDTMDAASKDAYLNLSVQYGNLSFGTRGTENTNPTGIYNTFYGHFPIWLKLVRTGNVFTGYTSTDGVTWSASLGSYTAVMGPTVYIGMTATSHMGGALTTAVFDNIVVTGDTGTGGTATNVSQGKTATASSIETTGYEATKAVDGSLTTRWSSAFSDPQWISVDLGSTYNITGVTLNWEAAYGKSYQIQISNDGSTWTPIYSTTTGGGGTEVLTGLTGTGRYVRLYGTQRGTAWGYSLFEFAVFGTPASAPTPIAVANQGFESGGLTGWSIVASGGYGSGAIAVNNVSDQLSTYPNFSNPLPGTAQGTYYAALTGYEGNPAEVIYQDVTLNGLGNQPLQPNTTYKLTVAVGVGRYSSPNNGYISLVNGTNPNGTVLQTANMSTLGFTNYANNFKDLTLMFTTGSTVSGDLTIVIATPHGYPLYGFIGIDNVRLTKQ